MDDLIYRQAAIDALAEHEKSRGHNYTMFVDVVSECAEIIRNLPSIDAIQVKRCKECKHWDGRYCHNQWWGDGCCGWAERKEE